MLIHTEGAPEIVVFRRRLLVLVTTAEYIGYAIPEAKHEEAAH